MKKFNSLRFLFATLFVTAFMAFTGCTDNEETDIQIPTMEIVTPHEGLTVAFDKMGGEQTFSITTSGIWEITKVPDWLSIDPLKGQGNATITVTTSELPVETQARLATLTVKLSTIIYGIEKEISTQDISVSQTVTGEPISQTAIYYNNFDKQLGTGKFPDFMWMDEDSKDYWMNHEGSGIETVVYTTKNMKVKNERPSNGYEGASGVNSIGFNRDYSELAIKNITLPEGKRNFTLTFGGSFYDKYATPKDEWDMKKINITLGNSEEKYSSNITYTKLPGETPNWSLFKADFTLPEGTTQLSIKFDTKVFFYTIDDVKLTEGLGGQEITFDGVAPTPPTPIEGAIYQNNFDKEKAPDGVFNGKFTEYTPMTDNDKYWDNKSGSGAETVTYANQSMKIASDHSSMGYDGASGMNKIKFDRDSWMEIQNITLPAGKRNFKISVGGSYYNGKATPKNQFDLTNFHLTLGNGTAWSKDVVLTPAGELAQDWVLLSADVTLPEGTQKLSIKFAAPYYYYSIDDVVVVEGNGGQNITFGGDTPEPTPGDVKTIKEIIALEKGAMAKTQGQIIAKHEKGFVIEDAAKDKLHVYSATTEKIGATVIVDGTKDIYNDMHQLKTATITLVKDGTYTYPSPKVWGATEINNYMTTGTSTDIHYIQIKGKLEIVILPPKGDKPEKRYYNVHMDGLTLPVKDASIENPLKELGIDAMDGQEITITGYSLGFAGKYTSGQPTPHEHFKILATKVGDGGVAPEPPTPGDVNTIAEATAGAPDDFKAVSAVAYTVQGQIVAANGNQFLIKDNTGIIMVYQGWDKANSKPMVEYTAKVGNTVKVTGNTNKNFGAVQFTDKNLQITEVSTGSYTQPTPVKFGEAELTAFYTENKPSYKYVEITGALTNPSGRYEIMVGAQNTEILHPEAGFVDAALVGKNVTLYGYTVNNNTKYKKVILMGVSIKEAGSTPEPPTPGPDPDPDPDPTPTPTPGDGSTITLNFADKATYPAGFPDSSANKFTDAREFTFGGYAFTLAGSSDGGVYQGVDWADKTTPYLMIGKHGAYIEVPAIAGKSLSKVTIVTRNGASTNVNVGIVTADAPVGDAYTFVAGGELQQWDSAADFTYNYTLSGTAVNTKYRILIHKNPSKNKGYNAQLAKLVLEYK